MKKFLNTAFGSYLKVFLTLALGYAAYEMIENKVTFFDLFNKVTLNAILTATFASFIPIIINASNSLDPRYGKKAPLKDLNPDRKV